MNITLCLLTRNERECVEALVPSIPAPGPEAGYDRVVAIDGNSTDGTAEAFARLGIPVHLQTTPGRGGAFLHAFAELPGDAWIFFSPDGNEAIDDLPRFRPLLDDGADVIIASRLLPDSVNEEDAQLFKFRKWANVAFNRLANWGFNDGAPIVDTINGYRAITRAAAERLELDASDYTIEYQMTIRAMAAGLDVREFATIEGQRIAGETGAPSIPTGLAFLRRLSLERRRHRSR